MPAPQSDIASYVSELQRLGDIMVRVNDALKTDRETAASLIKEGPVIGVVGQVKHRGLIPFTPNLDLCKVLTDAGIELNDPGYTIITIKRTEPSGKRVALPVFTFADLKRGKVSGLRLMPNDVIEVQRPNSGKWGH